MGQEPGETAKLAVEAVARPQAGRRGHSYARAEAGGVSCEGRVQDHAAHGVPHPGQLLVSRTLLHGACQGGGIMNGMGFHGEVPPMDARRGRRVLVAPQQGHPHVPPPFLEPDRQGHVGHEVEVVVVYTQAMDQEDWRTVAPMVAETEGPSVVCGDRHDLVRDEEMGGGILAPGCPNQKRPLSDRLLLHL